MNINQNSLTRRTNIHAPSPDTSLSPSLNHFMNTDEPEIVNGALNLSGLGISRINIKYKEYYKNLIKLDISHNSFSSASCFKYFFDLEELNASYNSVQRLNFVLPLARSLKKLDLAHNEIKTIENEVFFKFYFLEECDLSYNQITKLHLCHDLPRLRHLNLANNLINSVPQVNKFSSLTTLSLAYNQLEDLTGILKCFPASLKNLDISWNIVTNMTEFFYLRNMKILSLKVEGNPCVKAHGRGFCYRPFFVACIPSLTELDGFLLDDVDKLKGEFLVMNGLFNKFKPKVTSNLSICEFLSDQCPLSQIVDKDGKISLLKSVSDQKFSKILDSFRSCSSADTINDENVSPTRERHHEDYSKSHESINKTVENFNNLQIENLTEFNNLNLTHELYESPLNSSYDSGTRSVSESSNIDSSRTVKNLSHHCSEEKFTSINNEQVEDSEKMSSAKYHSLESIPEATIEDSKKLNQQVYLTNNKNQYNLNGDVDKIHIENSKVDIQVFVSDKQDQENIDILEISPQEKIFSQTRKGLITKFVSINRRRKLMVKRKNIHDIRIVSHTSKKMKELFNDAVNELRQLKEQNQSLMLEYEEKFNELKEVINTQTVTISYLEDKAQEQNKLSQMFEHLIAKIYPVVHITDVKRTVKDIIEVQWENKCSVIEPITGYDVYVNNKYAGNFKGANKFISIAKLDPNIDHEVRIKCVVEGFENISEIPSTIFKIKARQLVYK